MGIFWKFVIFFSVFIVTVPITAMLSKTVIGFIFSIIVTLAFPIYLKFFNTEFIGIGDIDPYIPLAGYIFYSLHIIFSGEYEHETKDGKRDKRYKNNEWQDYHDEETQVMNMWMALSSFSALLTFGLLDYFKLF